MKKRKLLDSFAMVAYLNREGGFSKVLDLMAEAQKAGDFVLMNEVNVGEVFYILHRKRGKENAEYFLESVIPALPLSLVSNEFDDVIAAARIKAEYPLSFADCFAVATAMKKNLMIVTGDPEFKKVEHLVSVDWMQKGDRG
ncbi:MAG: type II toxin-antitoxin system VapC family toxin [Deltaproteobacteria bacterium]|nr:type II toxin-antitoxin system VapC family toxin [Deltaproteobacteria bacterium]